MAICDCVLFDPESNDDEICHRCGHLLTEHEIVDLPGVRAGACTVDETIGTHDRWAADY